ncbi:MAG: hypothetical protein UT63_C0008G0013 [Candidatus Gottesmanbacteria bacterium GW2011_GWC2_39_8]|uniref:Uncharacterized protein n=1 Tax=Candidatus Gottesmanbacteria bacterium GW2011_GWC2_39_8 TaxID=1618450 RepID=A0A0G0Q0Y2_9BACT|nr:MAG: hypothetical protein UT63_C0008G0013 [Candidatus Gottesmanbacteria bacterium GW2011_GWC2_39_8]
MPFAFCLLLQKFLLHQIPTLSNRFFLSQFKSGLIDQNVPLSVGQNLTVLSDNSIQKNSGPNVKGAATSVLSESASYYTWGGGLETPGVISADLAQKEYNPFADFWNNLFGQAFFNKAEKEAKDKFLGAALPLGVGDIKEGNAQKDALKLRQQAETPLVLENFVPEVSGSNINQNLVSKNLTISSDPAIQIPTFMDNSYVLDAENMEKVKEKVKKSWPNSEINNWQNLEKKAAEKGFNPAFVLALWIEESGGSAYGDFKEVGGVWDLGCRYGSDRKQMPKNDLDGQIDCLVNKSYLDSTDYQKFICSYSGEGNQPCTFKNNPNFPKNLRKWYECIVDNSSCK